MSWSFTNFLFQINDTDNIHVDGDVPVEMDLALAQTKC